MDSTHHIDDEQVKQAADGRWPMILRSLAPELIPALDAGTQRHVRCPLGFHNDNNPSFRIDKPDEGRAICSCGSYDPWNLLEITRKWDFPECLRQVANVLHLDGGNGNGKQADPLARMAETKRCPVESLRVFGGTADAERHAVRFPMYGADGKACSTFTVWPDSGDAKFAKGMNQKGRPGGLFLPHDAPGNPRLPQAGETWIYPEGVKDCAALHGLGFTNVCGPSGKYLKSEWLPLFKGVHLLLALNNDAAGIEAAEKIHKDIPGKGPASVAIVTLPATGDVRDCIAALGADQVKLAIQAAIEKSSQAERRSDFPPVLTFRQLSERYPELQPEVIHGVARVGELVNVTSVTKGGKSMLTSDLALAGTPGVGGKWLDSFDVEPGRVLVLDNELDPRTLRYRIRQIADARGIPLDVYQDALDTVSFRGQLTDVFEAADFFSQFKPGQYTIIVLDALYRFLGDDVDENSNSDMARVYNQLAAYATQLECVLVVIHHASKGSQAGKAVTDVGSGAGAQSRAADTHLILRPHAESDAVVLEAVCRSFAPVEPRVLRWAWPCWSLASDLDPALKPDKQTRDKPAKDRQQIDDCREAIKKAMVSHPDHREVVRTGQTGQV